MKLARHSSKRVPLARKYNLEKKVKAHNHKLKKHANQLKKKGVLANKKQRGATAASISIDDFYHSYQGQQAGGWRRQAGCGASQRGGSTAPARQEH